MRSYASVALLFAAVVSATPVKRMMDAASTSYIFSFGDSYSQTGFLTTGTMPSCSNPMGNPSFPGDTTDNGVNWIGEVVQTAPGCILNFNFAFGGATVNKSIVPSYSTGVRDFIDQVSEFKSSVGSKPTDYEWESSNTAAAVWFGVNDVANSYSWSNSSAVIDADLDSYFRELQVLYDYGVRKFLLLTAPPFQRSPNVVGSGQDAIDGVRADILAWNAKLKSQAATWSAYKSDATFSILDTIPIFRKILNHPKQYGAPDATCYDSDGKSCLWWNSYHPGQAIQKAVGVAAYSKLYGSGSLELAPTK